MKNRKDSQSRFKSATISQVSLLLNYIRGVIKPRKFVQLSLHSCDIDFIRDDEHGPESGSRTKKANNKNNSLTKK